MENKGKLEIDCIKKVFKCFLIDLFADISIKIRPKSHLLYELVDIRINCTRGGRHRKRRVYIDR